MSESRTVRVLDVGQCGYDHRRISSLLTDRFGARVERADRIESALEAMREGGFDLVLVNRILDAEGSQGLDLIRRAGNDPAINGTPIMLVSNYEDAQQAAVQAGALPGFGKSDLGNEQLIERLAEVLGR